MQAEARSDIKLIYLYSTIEKCFIGLSFIFQFMYTRKLKPHRMRMQRLWLCVSPFALQFEGATLNTERTS